MPDFTQTLQQMQQETIKSVSAMKGEVKADFDLLRLRQDRLEGITRAPGYDGGGTGVRRYGKSLGELVTESPVFQAAQKNGFGRGAFPLRIDISNFQSERKSTITDLALGSGTTGLLMPQRLPGIAELPRQALRLRALMQVRQMTSGNAFDYVRQSGRTNAASPQVEAQTKGESTYLWNTVSDTVKTIAHFTNVSRQALEDVPWLQNSLNSELLFGLGLKEEAEILSGDGTGQHMRGLITTATAYNVGLNVSGDTLLDKLRHAKLQARLIGLETFAPDGFVLNPTDMERIELLKDETGGANKGRYIIGDPRTGTEVKLLWNLPVVESDSMAPGTFLVGAFSTGAQIIDRMQAMVELSYENADNFVRNVVTALCEARTGLATIRPEAFVFGSY